MAPLHRLSVSARSPLPPDTKRPSVFCVEGVERPALRPQMQHRTFDSPGRLFVSSIVFDVDRCGRSILLADPMNSLGVAKGCKILVKNLQTERTLAERIFKHRLGSAEQVTFR